MKSIDIKKLYFIHSWVGLITGILLFVIAFTGALSVFGRPEIKIWANPEIRGEINIDKNAIERLVAEQAAVLPAAYREEILIFLPGARSFPNLTLFFENHEAQQAVLLTFDNDTLELIAKKEGDTQTVFSGNKTDIADFIVDFHADLHLGRPVGLLLTGLLGLTLMASIVTGFIIHRQKLKQLFTFRFKKTFDITLADSHKLFGVWGMIFNGVIAFSGAFLGLATVLLIPAAAFVSFNGDQEKLIETFTTTPEPVLAEIFMPTKIAPALEHIYAYDSDMTPEVVTIYGYNDENAVIYISAVGSEAVARQIFQYQGGSGEFTEAFGQFGKVGGFSTAVLDLMFPLHFGNFGGAFVKLIWAILGLSTALLPLSGMMLWIERGQKSASPTYPKSTHARFNRLVIGTCGGVVLACSLLFPTQLILNSLSFTANTAFNFGIVFFSVWLFSIVFAFISKRIKTAATYIYFAIAGVLTVTPFLNIILTGDNLISMLFNKQWVAGITDVALLSFGVFTFMMTRKLSNASKNANNKADTKADSNVDNNALINSDIQDQKA